jgi:hypothetical protein
MRERIPLAASLTGKCYLAAELACQAEPGHDAAEIATVYNSTYCMASGTA